MADITKELDDFRNAIYGEEVRGSMISALIKVNKASEDAQATANSYQEQISDIREDTDGIIDSWFTIDISPTETVKGAIVKSGSTVGTYRGSSTTEHIDKYAVTDYEWVKIHVKQNEVYQFQTLSNIPYTENPNLIGSPVVVATEGDVILRVPKGANWLMVDAYNETDTAAKTTLAGFNYSGLFTLELAPEDTVAGAILKSGNVGSYAGSSTTEKIEKYNVSGINVVRFYAHTNEIFQFQNSANIPYAENLSIVGGSYLVKKDGYVCMPVPNGANYLMIDSYVANDPMLMVPVTDLNRKKNYPDTLSPESTIAYAISKSGTTKGALGAQSTTEHIEKYNLTGVESVRFYAHVNEVYQFQTVSNIPYTSNPNIVNGCIVVKHDGYVALDVPDRAQYLMVDSYVKNSINMRCKKKGSDGGGSGGEGIDEMKLFKREAYPYTMRNGGSDWEKRITFLHVSDAHVGTVEARANYAEAISVANAIAKDGILSAVIHSGDMTNGGNLSTSALIGQYATFSEETLKCNVPVLTQMGNHDANNAGDTLENVPSNARIWSSLFEGIKNKWSKIVWGGGNSRYHYIDVEGGGNHIRVIVLDMADRLDDGANYQIQWNTVYSQAQIDWLASAMDVPAGYGIIIVNHFPFAPKRAYSEESAALNDGYFVQSETEDRADGWKMIPEIVKAWKDKTTISKTYKDTVGNQDIVANYDFAGRNDSAQFICFLCGHTHSKNQFTVDGTDILMLCEDSSGQQGVALNRVYKWLGGEVDNAFSLLSVDMTERKIYRTAYGCYKKCSDVYVRQTMAFEY